LEATARGAGPGSNHYNCLGQDHSVPRPHADMPQRQSISITRRRKVHRVWFRRCSQENESMSPDSLINKSWGTLLYHTRHVCHLLGRCEFMHLQHPLVFELLEAPRQPIGSPACLVGRGEIILDLRTSLSFFANPNTKCTPLASHRAIRSSRAKPPSARNRMRTLGQRSRIWATMHETSSTEPASLVHSGI
jgi:hypothetical protein